MINLDDYEGIIIELTFKPMKNPKPMSPLDEILDYIPSSSYVDVIEETSPLIAPDHPREQVSRLNNVDGN